MHPAKKEAVQWITFPFYQGFDHFLIWPSFENDVSIVCYHFLSTTDIQFSSNNLPTEVFCRLIKSTLFRLPLINWYHQM